MSIKNFISNFQDELYVRRPLLHALGNSNFSPSNIEGAFLQTQEVLDELKNNIQFLDTESKDILNEIDEIFNSMEAKIDKIERFSDAIIGINSTEDTSKDILTIHPYEFNNNIDNWERIQKAYILTPESSYKTYKPFYNIYKDGKGIAKFLIDSSLAVKYVHLEKDYSTNITNITYIDSSKNTLSTESVSSNLTDDSIVLTVPISSRIVVIEYTYTSNTTLHITPLSFKHKQYSSINLETVKYKYANNLNFLINYDLPFSCYAQLNLTVIVRDLNDQILTQQEVWLPISNDGNIILEKQDVKDEKILRVWKEGLFKDITETEQLDDKDLVLCKPVYDKQIYLNTDHSLKLNIRHAKTIEIAPVLHLYSLASKVLTPRIFSITGMTSND